ncbi:MAG TPA: DNA gyrase subunit A [Candidatus Omnitrophica bacterium]|nr:DNA gyrase subunit A [Candidatus Omnitrophota bacterium]
MAGITKHVNIEEEMKSSYMDYAMSVIVSRALPDVRDGLKPVHRRILYAMRDLNLIPNHPYRKCAKIAGDVSGNYHPHGADIVYPSLVRMVQNFSMRYPLVDGQGNFGSIDGDPPAAMRYTEARMSPVAVEMLEDIEQNTVDFVPNYDGTRLEPIVLPSKIPNLLLNGSSGIAVGMATSIPPHNLREIIDGLVALLDKPQTTIEELMKHIKGPDFPTGGIICGREGITQAYSTGRGIIKIRAKAFVEGDKDGKQKIVISEIPYTMNKARIVESISELVREKKIEGISDIRDESDKDGMRIVLEMRRGKEPQNILNKLYRHTGLETTFGIILLALVERRPQILPLKDLLLKFLAHREEVVRRRTAFQLEKAKQKAHILEGLKVALSNLDKVIHIIKTSSTVGEARENLIKSFSLTETQAQAILDMRLQRLTSLERKKIDEDYLAIIKDIVRLESLLASPLQIREVIKEELLEIKKKYGDERNTLITEEKPILNEEDLIEEEDMVITISQHGYIKRLPLTTYRTQGRGGKGVIGAGIKEEDFIKDIFVASTHDYILCFSTLGKVYWIKVYEIPQAGRLSKGQAVVNFLGLPPEESITAFLNVKNFTQDSYIFMTTRQGKVKKTPLERFSHPRSTGIIAMGLDEDDSLIGADLISGEEDIILATKLGKAIRFSGKEVRPMGREAKGIIGIRFKVGDEVVGREIVREDESLLVVTSNGFGKKSSYSLYPRRGRGGSGVLNIKSCKRNGYVVGIKGVKKNDSLLIATQQGKIMRINTSSVRKIGRNTIGIRLISLAEEDRVSSFAVIEEEV